ncbi:MAG: SPASM domain-containing protein [Myxococcales bacterium]|nr:SPASM domain-containing protein [Myxococcales bacterium]
MTIVSNFSRVLTPREIEVLAQFEEIQVSIDIVDQKILRAVRKSVDVRSILYNSQLIQAHAIQHRIPMPRIVWTGVLTDAVVMGLCHLVATAASCSIRHINFNSVSYFDGAAVTANHVCDMPDDEFLRAAEEIERALALAKELDICMRVKDHRRIMRRVVKLIGKTRILDNGHYLAKLEDLVPIDRIFIYGSGAPGRYIAGQVKRRADLDFQGFLDSSWSGEIDESPVLCFDDYLEQRQSRDLILVCSESYDQIESKLKGAEIARYLDAREIYLYGANRKGGDVKIKRQGIQGTFETVGDTGDDLPEGLTRLCDSPWSQIYTDPKGEVYSCCQRGDSMGNLAPNHGFAEILNDESYLQLRRQLLTGKNLGPECSRCVAKPAATPEKMQAWIRAKLVQREAR